MFGFIKRLPQALRVANDVQTKGWYTSKTIWFNIIVAGLSAYGYFAGSEFPIAGEEIESISVALAVIGNVVLRFATSKPIGMRTERKPDSGADNRT